MRFATTKQPENEDFRKLSGSQFKSGEYVTFLFESIALKASQIFTLIKDVNFFLIV